MHREDEKPQVTCYFCKKPILKFSGRDPDSYCEYHISYDPEVKAPAHYGCHARFHQKNKDHPKKPKQKKRRPPWEKEGRYQYLLNQINKLLTKVDELQKDVRILRTGLAPVMDIPKDYLFQKIARDSVDELILEQLYAAGSVGLSPTELCALEIMAPYNLKPYQVSRRLQRINKMSKSEFDKSALSALHRRWQLSSWAKQIIGVELHDASEA